MIHDESPFFHLWDIKKLKYAANLCNGTRNSMVFRLNIRGGRPPLKTFAGTDDDDDNYALGGCSRPTDRFYKSN